MAFRLRGYSVSFEFSLLPVILSSMMAASVNVPDDGVSIGVI
jgi:hypothetical protein